MNLHSINRYPDPAAPTPLVPVQLSAGAPVIWCKLEFLNPSGSTKDRIARYIVGKALQEGRIKSGWTVVEASSGSTSIAMAMVCARSSERHLQRAFLARPVDLSRKREQEYCGFSCRIPGVIECVSTIFRESDYLSLTTIEVSDEEALETARALIRLGFPVGPSAGLNYRAAMLAAETLWPAKIVTVFPDRMERYFTTELFQPYI